MGLMGPPLTVSQSLPLSRLDLEVLVMEALFGFGASEPQSWEVNSNVLRGHICVVWAMQGQ